MNKTRLGVGLIAVAFFCLGMGVALLGRGGETTFQNSDHIFSYDLAIPSVYESAIGTANEVNRTGARSGIIAHHLLVGDKMAQTIAAIGSGREKTVVLLSPNHFDFGHAAMQVTDGVWETQYGEMEVDVQALDDLTGLVPELSDEFETFEREHGISAVVPLIKESFSNAKLLPIILHESATEEEVRSLAHGIVETIPNAVVIASIDMSHNLPEYVRVPHDEQTLSVIGSGLCRDACQLEIDANAALGVLLEINRLRGEQVWNQTHHGSSLSMGAATDWRENTSHILGYFTEGASKSTRFSSVQFVGDVMLDRGLRTWMGLHGETYPWEEVVRLLMGADVRIGNLEGTISEAVSRATEEPPFRFTFSLSSVEELFKHLDVVGLANNHTRDRDFDGERETQDWLDEIGSEWFGGYATTVPVYRSEELSVIGFHAFGTEVGEVVETISEEASRGQLVVVFPHWGEEYIPEPQDGQRTLAEQFVEAGADLIIGAHPHVIQGIENIDGVPVVYSLGNFIFDSFEPGTDRGLTVTLHFSEGEGIMYLMPVGTQLGQPVPLSDEEAQNIFIEIAELSSEELAPHILTGVVPFTYD